MELRKKEETRELETTKVILRQAGGAVIYQRGTYKKVGMRNPDDRRRKRKQGELQNRSKRPERVMQKFTAEQQKKWASYSAVQKKRILAQAEKAVKRKLPEQREELYKARKEPVIKAIVMKDVPEASFERDAFAAYRSGFSPKSVKRDRRKRKITSEHMDGQNTSGQNTGKVQAVPVQKRRFHNRKQHDGTADKKERKTYAEEIRKTRYEEQRRKKEQRRWNRIYAAELIGAVESDLRRDDWIRQQQMRGQLEASMGELEWKTGTATIRTVMLPVRVPVSVIRTKVEAALLQAGANLLKYAAAAVVPLVTALLIFLFAASLLSGIAGEEEQLGYASSGYEIVAYAEEWIGVTKYIWGAGRDSATAWQSYADCSSFVHGVFAHFGYEIGYDTYAQEHAGTLVSGGLDEALPGDIILFFSGYIGAGNSSHVAIYAGEGRMIHCSGGRSNVSPETAGRGVCWGYPTADGRPFQVRRIVEWASGGDAGNATSGHRKDTTSYTQSQMELIWAIVAQEDNGSYAGALAVVTSAMNRTESANWKYCGSNALAQLTASGQYCYSNDNYWRARLNGNVPSYVKQAVSDCLQRGIRNHSFTSFRSTKGSQTGPNAVQIGGNWYFGN